MDSSEKKCGDFLEYRFTGQQMTVQKFDFRGQEMADLQRRAEKRIPDAASLAADVNDLQASVDALEAVAGESPRPFVKRRDAAERRASNLDGVTSQLPRKIVDTGNMVVQQGAVSSCLAVDSSSSCNR